MTEPSTPITLDLDLGSLTIDELEMVEEALGGVSIEDAFKPGQRRAPVLRAIAWVVLRREDPDATLEDAGRVRISMSDAGDPPTDATS